MVVVNTCLPRVKSSKIKVHNYVSKKATSTRTSLYCFVPECPRCENLDVSMQMFAFCVQSRSMVNLYICTCRWLELDFQKVIK